MSNPYYALNASLFETLAIAHGNADVEAELSKIQTAFDLIATQVADLELGNPIGFGGAIDTRWTIIGVKSGATYQCSMTPVPSSQALVQNMHGILRVDAANTGACSLTITGTTNGAVDIKKVDGAGALIDLDANDLMPNLPATVVFDGTRWVLSTKPIVYHNAGIYNTGAQNINSATDTAMVLDELMWDNGGMEDTANNRLEVQKAGFYLLIAGGAINNMDAGEYVAITIKVNGAAAAKNYTVVPTGFANVPYACAAITCVYCSVGQFITASIEHNEGAAQNTVPPSYLMAFLLTSS